MGRKREEIDVLASHYYCRANWQGYYIPHNGATVFLEEHFGGTFWRDILVGRKREEIDVLTSHYYTAGLSGRATT